MTKRKTQDQYKITNSQRLLGIHLDELGLYFIREHKFCDRDWRIDILIPDYALAIEISGGNWHGGHRRFKAQEDEYDKLNQATILGLRVLQFTNDQVDCGHAKQVIAEYLTSL